MKAISRRPDSADLSGLVCTHSGSTLEPAPLKLAAILSWKQVFFCAVAVALSAVPFHAQKGAPAGGGGTSRGTSGRAPGGTVTTNRYPTVYSNPTVEPEWQPFPDIQMPPRHLIIEDEKCLPWNVSEMRAAAVSVSRLKIPSKASHEYDKACDANNKKKFDEAAQHLHAAIDKFQDYAAAWVLLGVVQEEQGKGKEATDACAHAIAIDSTYLPGYLCGAEFSTRKQEWENVLNLSNLALGLNPAGDGYAYYYRAIAYFHMKNLVDAKKSALQAAEIDVKRNEVPLDFLLAQIYDADGDKANAADKLRQILKNHNGGQQADAVKQYLAKLEAEQQDAK